VISNPMRVVVIRGTGFISSHLIDGLVREGFRVRVVDNLNPRAHFYLRAQKSLLPIPRLNATVRHWKENV
jgi:nucleoside-diphosphate-sugar epimerase